MEVTIAKQKYVKIKYIYFNVIFNSRGISFFRSLVAIKLQK